MAWSLFTGKVIRDKKNYFYSDSMSKFTLKELFETFEPKSVKKIGDDMYISGDDYWLLIKKDGRIEFGEPAA